MSVQLFNEEELPRNEWNGLVGDSLYGSPEFLALWNESGGKPIFIVEEKDGGFRAGLAGVVFGKGLFRRFESNPRNIPGGIFVNSHVEGTNRRTAVENILLTIRRHGQLRTVITPIDSSLKYPGYEKKQYETHLIDLDDDQIDYPQSLRGDIKAAISRGGEIDQLSEKSEINRLYKMYVQAQMKHNDPRMLDCSLFSRLCGLAITDERVVFLVARAEGRPIGIHVDFINGDRFFNWQLAIDRDFVKYKPGQLMMLKALELAREKGCRIFDMGSGPKGAESLHKYKAKWGGNIVKVPYYESYNLFGKLIYKGLKR